MNDIRPNPETLLAKLKADEIREAKGKLKIFFGAAPGVGKTHTMLEDALERFAEGQDIIAGVVETHGRREIGFMSDKLEQLPPQKINYHGHILREFDLDAALERKPKIILIDELAHTNLPNSRHAKRWQDVKEILERGINVYTTLNVQHLESLNDVVAQITGITVRETVPDLMIEQADVVELIDLPPDDLLKRLQEGRVYAPEQAELARKNFFNRGNLIALRELALRITAERVGAQVLSYRESQSIQKTWPTTERLLVCIQPNAQSAKLVRAARRMASRLQAEWMAVYVEGVKAEKLSDVERHHLENNFRLAERLGGETHTLNGRQIVEELLSFARDRNVTKIVIGKEMRSRIKTFFFGSLVDELLRRSGDIDIYVIQGGYDRSYRFLPIINSRLTSKWQAYLIALLPALFCTLLGFLVLPQIDLSNFDMLYLLGVVVAALGGRRGPALLATFASIISLDFFFIPPRYSFAIKGSEYLVTFIVMSVVALIISHLTISHKHQERVARLRERRTLALYALTRKLAASRGVKNILQIAAQHIGEVFDSQVAVFLPNDKNELTITANAGSEFTLDDKEISVARWVYDLGQTAGMGTQTLPFVPAIYVPLVGKKSIVGVLRILPADPHRLIASEQIHLLETFANQTAFVIEADRVVEGN